MPWRGTPAHGLRVLPHPWVQDIWTPEVVHLWTTEWAEHHRKQRERKTDVREDERHPTHSTPPPKTPLRGSLRRNIGNQHGAPNVKALGVKDMKEVYRRGTVNKNKM